MDMGFPSEYMKNGREKESYEAKSAVHISLEEIGDERRNELSGGEEMRGEGGWRMEDGGGRGKIGGRREEGRGAAG
jgi:hypothetical protein